MSEKHARTGREVEELVVVEPREEATDSVCMAARAWPVPEQTEAPTIDPRKGKRP